MIERSEIEQRRIALGWSRAELAERAGFKHGATIWKVERQLDEPVAPLTLSKISLVLDAAEAALRTTTTADIADLEQRLSRVEGLLLDVLSRLGASPDVPPARPAGAQGRRASDPERPTARRR